MGINNMQRLSVDKVIYGCKTVLFQILDIKMANKNIYVKIKITYFKKISNKIITYSDW